MGTDTRRRKKGFRIVIWIASLLVVALVATVVILCRDDLSVAGIRNKMQQIFGHVTLAQEYSYDGGEGCIVRVLEDGVAVVNTTGVKVYDTQGHMNYTWSLEMTTPAVSSAGAYAVMYDVGGTSLAAFTSQEVTATIPTDGKIIYAAVNDAGWFVVCMAESTYTSSATVYNPQGTAVYKWYSADGYAAAATVTQAGDALAVAVYGAGGTAVVCLNLDSTDEVSRTELEDTAVLDLWWSDTDTLMAVTDYGVSILAKSGGVTVETPMETEHLIGYARLDHSIALVGSDYAGSAGSVLWTVSDSGTVLGKTEISDQVSSISAAGRYIALLCGDTVFVYNDHIREYAIYTGANGANSIQVCTDGTVLAAGGYYAWLLDRADRQQTD
jgi:hypothetical protein